MKKVGVFLGSRPGGGEFQYHLTILDAVSALPVDTYSVVCCYTSDIWIKHIYACGMRSVAVSSGFWGRVLSLLWTRACLHLQPLRSVSPLFNTIARAVVREQCDLWIFPYPTAKSFQIPVPALVSIHDLMHRYERRFPESSSGLEYFNRELNITNICRWSKGVLVDSETGRKQLHKSYGMPMERIHVLPFTPPSYIYSVETPYGFDDRYRLPDKFIFYPAQFWEHKNHKKLVGALHLLKPTIPDLKLVLTGSRQNAFDSTVELVRKYGLTDDVFFLGYVPDNDMPELYRRARALVMPTFYGPTNIPPLEAFVAGCPVAISGVYAMPEQAGGAALHFNPESVDEIAECIRRLWLDDELCSELASKGKRRAEEWGQKQFNERLHSIIEAILGYPENQSVE